MNLLTQVEPSSTIVGFLCVAVFVVLLAGVVLAMVRTLLDPKAWGGIIVIGIRWMLFRGCSTQHADPPVTEAPVSVPEAVMKQLTDEWGVRRATTTELMHRHRDIWKAGEAAGTDVAKIADEMMIAEGKYLGCGAYGPDATWGGWKSDRISNCRDQYQSP